MIDKAGAPTLFPMEAAKEAAKRAIHVELSQRERAVVDRLNGHNGR